MVKEIRKTGKYEMEQRLDRASQALEENRLEMEHCLDLASQALEANRQAMETKDAMIKEQTALASANAAELALARTPAEQDL